MATQSVLRTFKKKVSYYVSDFETSVYEGQTETEVWAAAIVKFGTENVKVFNSISDYIDELFVLAKSGNICTYFHNLKFDGVFIIDYILRHTKLKPAFAEGSTYPNMAWLPEKDMPTGSYKYMIADTGIWYNIVIKPNSHYTVEIRDSLKLLPFSVKKIGKDFKTQHQKLEIEYEGERHAGWNITEEEKQYIANDVLVVKEALEIMHQQGHTKLTIGACCLAEFVSKFGSKAFFNQKYPNLYEEHINDGIYGSATIGDYVNKAYRGGWVYVVEGKENKVYKKGLTGDVNSLYPSMMHSMSGNKYPKGYPTFWSGNYIPEEATNKDRYYYVRFECRFEIKDGYLPFVQIKHNLMYPPRECLKTSRIRNPVTGEYFDKYLGIDGEVHNSTVILTMTETDLRLFLKHYNVYNFRILDGCYFHANYGVFDDYINKYMEIKKNSTGAIRQIAKLFLNNLYGKMATSPRSAFRYGEILEEDEEVKYFAVDEPSGKVPGYIAIGAAITSYARCFTITAAQANYHGVDKPGFIYADTDSIHCDLEPDELQGITVHESNFCCWKLESYWDEGIFVRPKTYIEHVTHEDGEKLDKPYYNVKCAGMNQACKDLFLRSMEPYHYEYGDEKLKPEKIKFLQTVRTIEDFKIGLEIPGKLLPKHIKGGVVLTETTYKMR